MNLSTAPPAAGNIHVDLEPWTRVPIERYGRPRPYEGTHAVGRMSASEPFDGTRGQGGDNHHVDNHCPR